MPKFYKNYEEAVEAARKSVTHMGRAAVLVVSDGNNFSFCDNDSREIEAAFHFGYEVVSGVDYSSSTKKVYDLIEELKNATDGYEKTWYALHFDSEDQEDGHGSNDIEDVARRAIVGGYEEIALIYDNGTDETYATVSVYDD